MTLTKQALVTGCSSGFGRLTALELLRRGWVVYATVRTEIDTDILYHDAGSERLTVIHPFDVRTFDPTVIKRLGPLDAVVNCAGYALWGPLETVDHDEAQAQFDVNVLGTLSVIRAVLPAMRAARRGVIINIGSTADKHLTVGGALYAASKSALRVLALGLALEVKPFGISAFLLEPDRYATGYVKKRVIADRVDSCVGWEYLDKHGVRRPESTRQDEQDPAVVARVIANIVENPDEYTQARSWTPMGVIRAIS